MKKENTHIIRTVHFAPKTNDGPLECSCGEEMPASTFNDHREEMPASTFNDHRKAMNAPKGTSESDLPKAFSLWRRSTPGKTI